MRIDPDPKSEAVYIRSSGIGTEGNPLRLFDLEVSPDMSALVGNGLGGGWLLINAGVLKPPDDSIFEKRGRARRVWC